MKNSSTKMKLVRKKIDQIDDKLLPLMVKRSKLVEKALSLKKNKSEIIDKKRIEEISKKISKKTTELGGNSKLLKSIWLSIIKNFIDYENREFKKK